MGSKETNHSKNKTQLTEDEIEAMMKAVVLDYDLECPYCGDTIYEPDYEKCNGCGRKNPLKERGLI